MHGNEIVTSDNIFILRSKLIAPRLQDFQKSPRAVYFRNTTTIQDIKNVKSDFRIDMELLTKHLVNTIQIFHLNLTISANIKKEFSYRTKKFFIFDITVLA